MLTVVGDIVLTTPMSTEHPLVGRKIQASTEGGRVVAIEVTAVQEDGSVWGYRLNTQQRRLASSSFPRRYWPVVK